MAKWTLKVTPDEKHKIVSQELLVYYRNSKACGDDKTSKAVETVMEYHLDDDELFNTWLIHEND